VSKWENGKGIPDTSLLPSLCKILEISINELLNGERIQAEKYEEMAEQKLLDFQKMKEESDKKLLLVEYVIGILSVIILLSMSLLAAYLKMPDWLRIVIISFAFAVCFIGFMFALRIEQVAGYYVCKKCEHKYVPSFNQVLWAMHMGRTRYMKCPHCHKWSWHKKVVK
jgi:transcriptional regulator with XRE-family HTH domain